MATTAEVGDVPTLPVIPDEDFSLPPVRVRDVLLGSGPRMVRDASAPLLAFYLGWQVAGLLAGIALSTAAALAGLAYERSKERSGLMAQIQLGLILVQALVGIVSGSEKLFLAQPVLISAGWGLAFIGSALIGRPLVAAFAEDMYPFPDEVRQSVTYRQVFTHISLVWGVYLLGRSLLRLDTLTESTVGAFVAVNLVTGIPLTTALMGWSVWYAVRFFRRSDEWGDAIRMLDDLAQQPAARELT